jgi:hypothetical protein
MTPDEIGKNYKLRLGNTPKKEADANIVVGGKTGNFVPNLNFEKWQDECYVNVNYTDTVVTNEVETFTGDEVSLKVGQVEHKYRQLDGQKLEWDIVLHQKPPSNKFVFDISASPEVTFAYQGTLEDEWQNAKNAGIAEGQVTLEEYLATYTRPDEVVGSYAIYCSKSNNKYQTGKIAHIYRPLVIDADNNKTWAELDYAAGKLTVTVKTSWLNAAKYPVTIDPVFGYNADGGSGASIDCVIRGGVHTLGDNNAEITTMYAWLENFGSGDEVLTFIYDDTDQTLEASTSVRSDGAGDGFVAFTFAANPTLAAQDWSLCAMSDGAMEIGYDATDWDRYYDSTPAQCSPPIADDPFTGTMGVSAYKISIYAEYSTGGGTVPKTTQPIIITKCLPVLWPLAAVVRNNVITRRDLFKFWKWLRG